MLPFLLTSAESVIKGVLREGIQKPSFLRKLGKSACPFLSQLYAHIPGLKEKNNQSGRRQLDLEVMQHHFCHILLRKSESQRPGSKRALRPHFFKKGSVPLNKSMRDGCVIAPSWFYVIAPYWCIEAHTSTSRLCAKSQYAPLSLNSLPLGFSVVYSRSILIDKDLYPNINEGNHVIICFVYLVL